MAVAAVDDRELIKAMSWFDGFVVALANPSFLLTALGGSVLSLGGWGAAIVWTFSVFIGALHNNIYAEVATMFPKLSGGVAVYAHEAWKRYTSFVGPIAAVGYWLGWSVVLSLNGAIVGFLLQSQFFSDSTFATGTADWWVFTLSSGPAILIGAVLIVIIWVANVFGVRPAVWTGYVTGILLLFPLFVLIFLPYITGRLELEQPAQPDRLGQHADGPDDRFRRLTGLQQRLAARDHVALPDVLVVLRLRVLRVVRARVPRPRARHRQGAARGRGVRRVRLRASCRSAPSAPSATRTSRSPTRSRSTARRSRSSSAMPPPTYSW